MKRRKTSQLQRDLKAADRICEPTIAELKQTIEQLNNDKQQLVFKYLTKVLELKRTQHVLASVYPPYRRAMAIAK